MYEEYENLLNWTQLNRIIQNGFSKNTNFNDCLSVR